MAEGSKSESEQRVESWDHPVFMAFIIIMLILGATFLFVSAGYIDDTRNLITEKASPELEQSFLKRHSRAILGLVLATGLALLVAFIVATIVAAKKRHPKEMEELKERVSEVLTPRSKAEKAEKAEGASPEATTAARTASPRVAQVPTPPAPVGPQSSSSPARTTPVRAASQLPLPTPRVTPPRVNLA